MVKLKREGVNRLFFVKSPTKEKCRFTVPPTVALLNYISSGILWWIFSQTRIFAGFSLHIYYSPEGAAKLRWEEDIIFFHCQKTIKLRAHGCKKT